MPQDLMAAGLLSIFYSLYHKRLSILELICHYRAFMVISSIDAILVLQDIAGSLLFFQNLSE